MQTRNIQQILAEQRKISKIFQATPHEIAMQINNNLKGQEVHAKKSATMKEKYQDPAFATRHAQQQLELANTVAWQTAHADGMKRREANGWHEKNVAAGVKRRKAIQTPYGRFESKALAVEAMQAAGVGNAGGKLSVWLNTKSTEYYYIV